MHLESLIRLPSTAELEASVAGAEAALAEFRQRPGYQDLGRLRNLESDLKQATRQREQAQARDALLATRPEDCWCLGLGGEGMRWLSGVSSLFEMWAFDRYCECSEGQQVRAEHLAMKEDIAKRRHQARVEESMDGSEIPPRFWGCTFAGYPVSDATRDAVERIKLWVFGAEDGASEERVALARAMRGSLLLYGPFGTGKTGLAVATLRALIRLNGADALFTTVPVLLDTIRRGYDRGRERDEDEGPDLLERVKESPYLVLDDLGAERVTDWVAERLFVIVNHRHDHELLTIFTSNLSPDQLGAHIGERTMWRIVEMCEIVKLDGPNLRDRAAK